MSAVSDRRFELVESDAAQPFSVREIASNGRQTWRTAENYARKEGALRALVTHISWLHPRIRVWLSNGTGGVELRIGMPDDTYLTARVVEVRDVDKRTKVQP